MLSLQKLPHPLIPMRFKAFQRSHAGVLVANGVIDGVVSDQFEVPERPVVGNGGKEVVHGGVLHSEFAGIVGIYGHCIAQAQQDGR